MLGTTQSVVYVEIEYGAQSEESIIILIQKKNKYRPLKTAKLQKCIFIKGSNDIAKRRQVILILHMSVLCGLGL